jgi:hypothetical protein
MDAVRATAATANADTTPAPTSSPSPAAEPQQSFATLFADAEKGLKSGERLTKVDGHEFGRIKGGERDDMCVNLSGNTRTGQAFDLIWRDGRQFHVYGGTGADHQVVEVGKKAAAGVSPTGGTATG